jgi:hypothetical protein
MKHVGILTFHRGPNYGGFLQAWHLRAAVRAAGHEATVINYQSRAHHEAERIKFPRFTPAGLKGFALHALKCRPFGQFVKELSDHDFITDATALDWQGFSTVVVGADIVWNFSNPQFGPDPVWFGAHPAQRETRVVAYAPSCGEADPTGTLPEHVVHGLPRFASIQVRDEATATLVERVTGSRPPVVVDPSWLQDDPAVTCRKIPANLKYALVYGQGATGTRARLFGDYCRKRGLKIVSATFPCEATTHRLYSLDPFEWVDLFRRAECVVTSTFHGLLYAIKYGKPLLFMNRGPSRSKSAIVIDRGRLQDRVVDESEPFDPDHLAHCLSQAGGCEIPAEWRSQSLELLRRSLKP